LCIILQVPQDKEGQKYLWKKLKRFLDQTNIPQVDEIKTINAKLHNLSVQRNPNTAHPGTVKHLVSDNCHRMQNMAKSLFEMLRDRFGTAICACPTPHIANFPLQMPMNYTCCDRLNGLRLKVLFHLDFGTVSCRSSDIENLYTLEFEQMNCKQVTTGTVDASNSDEAGGSRYEPRLLSQTTLLRYGLTSSGYWSGM
jgi:hypothetical protein